jgi:hypothetical protein
VQNKPITAAVQPTPHVCAPAAVIDLIAVADVETGLGAVPPNRVLDEPGKHLGKPWIEPAGINPCGNPDENVSAAAWPVAGRAIRMVGRKPVQDSGSMKEVVNQGIDGDEAGTDLEPTGPGCPGPHQQGRQCHGDDLVGDPIDMPQRVDQGGPGPREVGGSRIVGELVVNPSNDVATGNVPDEQEQAVRSLVQPPVPEAMPGQGAVAELFRLGAGLEALVVPAVGKRPIPLELVATGVGGERVFDIRPGHVPMPIHVPIGHGVRDTLVAKLAHQPIEDRRSVMGCDGSAEAGCDCVNLKVVDAGNLTGKVADSPNKRAGMPHSMTTTVTGRKFRHVRSTPPTGAERRCRRQCTAGSSEWIGDQQESEHPGATHRLYGRGGQPE